MCELKKDLRHGHDRAHRQLHAELLAADLKADDLIVGILTDLRNVWTFTWIRHGDQQRELATARAGSRDQGLEWLHGVLEATPDDMRNAGWAKLHEICHRAN